VGLGHSPSIVMNGLVLALDAGNTKSYPRSGTTWTNLLGTGSNGTLTNGPTYSSANGGSIVFDGVDDNVSRTSFNTGQNFTVSAWIYPTLLGTTRRAIVANSYPYATRTGWLLCTGGALETNTFFLSIGADVAYNTAASNSLELNKWQFVVATVTNGGESILLYVNSVLVGTSGSALNSGTITYTDSQFYVGYRHTTNTDPYSGNISQVSVYNRVLSAAEIQQNYNALKGRFVVPSIVTNGLVLNLDAGNSASYSGSGTTWTDISGSGNTGTLVNGPTYSSANGGSIVFDGTNDYVSTSVNFGGSSQFTVSMFVNNTSRGPSDGQILSIGNEKLLFYTRTGDWEFSVYSPTIFSNIPRYTSTIMQLNTWYNLVGVYSGTAFEMFINGQSIYYTNTSISLYTLTTESVQIARRINTGLTQFPSKIATTSIYNRALSAAEVSQNFEANRWRFNI